MIAVRSERNTTPAIETASVQDEARNCAIAQDSPSRARGTIDPRDRARRGASLAAWRPLNFSTSSAASSRIRASPTASACSAWPAWPRRPLDPPAVGEACRRGARQADHLRHVRGPRALPAPLPAARLRPRARAAAPRYLELPPAARPRRGPGVPAHRCTRRCPRSPATRSTSATSTRLLEPYADGVDDEDAAPQAAAVLDQRSTGCCPDAFAHANLGPDDTPRRRADRCALERELLQVVPNLTLQVDPQRTPDDLHPRRRRDGLRLRQAALRQPPDDGRRPGRAYAAVSCYNSLRVGGGSHTLVRLNLEEAVAAPRRRRRRLPRRDAAALRRAHRRADGGAHPPPRRAGRLLRPHLAGPRGAALARPVLRDVRHLRAGRGRRPADGARGRRRAATATTRTPTPSAYRITERVAALVAARPMPYCEGNGGRRLPALPVRASTSTSASPPAPASRSATEPPLRRAPAHRRPAPPAVRLRRQRRPRLRRDRARATRRRSSTSSAAPSRPACATSPSTSTATTSSASPATSCASPTSPRSRPTGARHGSTFLGAGSVADSHVTTASQAGDEP